MNASLQAKYIFSIPYRELDFYSIPVRVTLMPLFEYATDVSLGPALPFFLSVAFAFATCVVAFESVASFVDVVAVGCSWKPKTEVVLRITLASRRRGKPGGATVARSCAWD
jgi:hypothetical protein